MKYSPMCLIVLLCFLTLTHPHPIRAVEQVTAITNVTVGTASKLQMERGNFAPNEFLYLEPPITQFFRNGTYNYVSATSFSYYCHSGNNLLTAPVSLNSDNCTLIQKPSTMNQTMYDVMPENVPATEPWRRSYQGAYSTNVTTTSSGGAILVNTNHAENKNELVNGKYYSSSINPVDPHQCASGFSNGMYTDCGLAYNAFVTQSYSTDGGATFTDIGPVVWPEQGYMNVQGQKTSKGVYFPRTYQEGNSFYVYYHDGNANNGLPSTANRQCIKVAKATIDPSTGLPGNFYTYYRGSFSSKSLPSGFTKERMTDFYAQNGGAGDCLLPQFNPYYYGLAVTKLAGTTTYIGITHEEDYTNPAAPKYSVVLFTSPDLVHWYNPTKIFTDSQNTFNYPSVIDAEGKTNTTVNPSNFYILGASSVNSNSVDTYKLPVSLSLGIAPATVPSVLFSCPATGLSEPVVSWNPDTTNSGYYVFLEDGIGDGSYYRESVPSGTTTLSLPHQLRKNTDESLLTALDDTHKYTVYIWYNAIKATSPRFTFTIPHCTATNTPTPTPTPTPNLLPGDTNHDGKVDIFDYNLMVAEFGKTGALPSDINGDGKVDIFDYNILVTNFGKMN